MSRVRVVGWLLILVAVLSGILSIPELNASTKGSGGAMSGESSLFGAKIVGDGKFTYETWWSISWPAAVVNGLLLAAGVLLVRQRSQKPEPAVAPAPTGSASSTL